MELVNAAVRIVAGLIFGVIAAMALTPGIAVFSSTAADQSAIVTTAIVIVIAVITFLAPTIRRAFGRGFLIAGVSLISLPLSVIVLSGQAIHEAAASGDIANAGQSALVAGVATVAVSGVVTLFGLTAGAIFVIIGLVLSLGGRREAPRR